MSYVDEFSRSVEDGLKLSKRIYTSPKDQRATSAPPRHPGLMERSDESFLPTGPMVYAVISDPGIVDNPDVPSYQPYVYGRCDPPALIPLQMKEIELEMECVLDTVFVTVRGRWWVHCVTRSRACDCRIVVPMGEQGSILGVEVEVGKKSYATEVVDLADERIDHSKSGGGGFLKPHMLYLPTAEANGGSDVFATIKWSQKLLYDEEGQFTVHIPFNFPTYVNASGKIFVKREKIKLKLNSGIGKEVILKGASHPLKEKARQGGNMTFVYDEAVENWSTKDFNFSYSVHAADVFGGLLLQSASVQDYDQRDMFCLFLIPGNNKKRKVFRREVVFLIDTSGSMQRKPIESVKNAVFASLLELTDQDFFNIVSFSDEVCSFSTCLVPATEEMVESANQWMGTNLVAKGGTNISRPFNEVLASLANTKGSIPHIFLITDGTVEDERNICANIQTTISNTKSIVPRISTFGIGLFCNHYFLRMLASIGRGHYDAEYDPDSIESRMRAWFRRCSRTTLANMTIDAFNNVDDSEFEVYPQNMPDISAGCITCIYGRYKGELPNSVKAKGCLADMSAIEIDLKVEHAKDMHLEKVFARRHIDFLTAQAWLYENKQLENKITKLSIQNSVPSEYTHMIMLQKDSVKDDTSKAKKHELNKRTGPEERLPILIHGLAIGFGNLTATRDNMPINFGELKPPEALDVMFTKAAGCCGSVADCCCCMCLIRGCSKVNDQCFIVITQLFTALACLGCLECCSEVCCCSSDS
ncbi:inter alpha-trypsin inhibitor, heavy chain 4-like protein [Carex littledalei]|uniref:Inter alpha-trypsin inhibitor, heavy chain 4-like protein n=1 Tax=Carex littledalei TaxID=544730 RepID=A0A833VGF2_9POAL|nr:inter alpha-trypsin inhibitor, heavy chain 4-like protein [Carex littledalei]